MSSPSDPTQNPPPRGPPPGATSPPPHVNEPKIFEVFNAPPASANTLPDGYGQNTAGARPEIPALSEAVKTVRIQDFAQVHMYPCVRESLLSAFGGAFGLGGLRALLGAPIMKSCNWAVGTFCFVGAGAYEYCLYKRRIEKANMKRAVDIIDRKKAEKEAQAKEKRDARRKAKEEADRLEEEAAKRKSSSWKFW